MRKRPKRAAKSNVIRIIDLVADQLNNTRAVCRKYYVHPAVFEHYLAGTMDVTSARSRAKGPNRKGLDADERAVVELLAMAC